MRRVIREEIKAYYGSIARRAAGKEAGSCCGGSSCCGEGAPFYSSGDLEGLPEEAIQASLGCANPVALANLQQGETVLDLGSGGGIDALISSKYVGETGKVYGLDMTDEMLELARRNQEKSGAANVEFIKGYIEEIPLADETVDVVLSNCVINLSGRKEDALREAYRVLKKGGRLAIADIVRLKPVPESLRRNIQMWVSCVSGALGIEEYERILKKVGFKDIEITPVNHIGGVPRGFAEEKNPDSPFSAGGAWEEAFAAAYVKARKGTEPA